MQNHQMTQFIFSCSYIVCFLLTRIVDSISPGWLLSPRFSRTFHQVVECMSPPLEPGWTSVAVQPAAEQLQREGHKSARCCHRILLNAAAVLGRSPTWRGTETPAHGPLGSQAQPCRRTSPHFVKCKEHAATWGPAMGTRCPPESQGNPGGLPGARRIWEHSLKHRFTCLR